MSFDIVVPTIGRPSLAAVFARVVWSGSSLPARLFIVDDRRGREADLPLDLAFLPPPVQKITTSLRSNGRGPAAARNVGWRAATAEWIAFVDDDVVLGEAWLEELARDLRRAGDGAGASYASIRVPLPRDRRPTDWERNVAALERARFITADAAVRREALVAVRGFDERFPRAYREDADLALRLAAAGYELASGARTTQHPVRPASRWVSVTLQRGNADDALMEALHGAVWHDLVRGEGLSYGRHAKIVANALGAIAHVVAGRPERARPHALRAAAGIALFATGRILPGPRNAAEIATMLVTSALIPFAAVFHRVRGIARANVLAGRPKAVLFDRDGTLVADTPIGGDASRVRALPGVARALARLRRERIAIGVVTNQPGLGRGAFSAAQHASVCERIESLVGRIDTWAVCAHTEDAQCACRKPKPELIARAASALGVRPDECVVIGDIGSDVRAARAAGARSILVPTPLTRGDEIATAPRVAPSVGRAVDLVLSGRV